MSGEIEVLRHPRARRARLSVDPATGRVRLTVPPRMAVRTALAWAEDKRDWIAQQRAQLPVARPFVPGATIPLDDRDLLIEWDAAAPRTPAIAQDRLVVGGDAAGVAPRVERWLRREALGILHMETGEYAARAGVEVESVAIGDPRARWGSCTTRGAIRYSWRLVLAPRFVRRATVAHEVAHRVHMHHGPAFHALVAELYEGDPAAARAWLRANGAALHWFGRYS